MAIRHSTPAKRRSPSTRKPTRRPFVQRIAPEVVAIDACLREALKQLKQAARASRRLGGKVYWEIRAEEKRR